MELSVRLSKSNCFKPRSMTCSFRTAHFSMVFYQQKASKNEMLKQIRISANEIHYYDFPKVAVLTH